jgi:hypothetical protein
MTRFTLPALGMIAAIAVLVAGAFGDLPSWRSEVPVIVAQTSSTIAGARTSPNIPAQPETLPTQGNDLAQRQAQDLRAKIAQETQELGALRASAEQARRDLAALREQRQREQAALVTTGTNQRAADGPPTSATLSPDRGSNQSSAATKAPVATSRDTSAQANVPSQMTASPEPVAAQQRLLATRRLRAARTALTTGHRGRARWLLSVTRSQMAQSPSTFVQPGSATVGSPEKTVEDAIGLLNRGDRDGAVRAIDQVLAAAGGDTGEPARRTD